MGGQGGQAANGGHAPLAPPWRRPCLRRDFDRSRFGLVRNRSDFDSSGSVNRKRVYGSVCDQSEPSS